MNSKVIVLADETTGAVVNVSQNNSEYGYIRVQQVRTMIDDNGFLRRKPISALVPGTLAELKESGFLTRDARKVERKKKICIKEF